MVTIRARDEAGNIRGDRILVVLPWAKVRLFYLPDTGMSDWCPEQLLPRGLLGGKFGVHPSPGAELLHFQPGKNPPKTSQSGTKKQQLICKLVLVDALHNSLMNAMIPAKGLSFPAPLTALSTTFYQ